MSDYAKTRREVVGALDRFEQLIIGGAPAASTALLQARVQLVQSVNAYLAAIGRCAGSAGGERAGDTRARQWREAHEELLALRLRYSEHITRWSGPDIAGGWQAYKGSCNSLIASMRRHLDGVASFSQHPA